MALTTALFTGLSGLDVNQSRLAVVGNNIANVNTTAFKSSRALFKPQFYVTDGAGSAPSDDFGGTNPSQRGLGASVAAIEKNFAPGSIETTGRATDMAIDGNGFFIVENIGEQKFTRDGSFSLNAFNELVTTDGSFVQGYGVDNQGNVVPGSLDKITVPLGTTTTAKATANVALEGNLNASGTIATGASILNSQSLTLVGGAAAPATTDLLVNVASTIAPATPLFVDGDTFTLRGSKGGRELPERTFQVDGATTTVQDLMDFFEQGLGVDTTLPDDLDPTTPLPGASIRTVAGAPPSIQLALTGNPGEANALAIEGTAFARADGTTPLTFIDGQDANGVLSNPVGESIQTTFVAYDSLGTPVAVDVSAVLESKSDNGNTWRFYVSSGDDTDVDTVIGNGTLTFDAEGRIKDVTGNVINVNRTDTGARTPLTMELDFSTLTSLTSRDSNLVMTEQDGSQIGSLNSFSVGADGKVMGSFSNGLSQTLGQLAIATFANNQGLVDRGGNMFVAGADSGVAVISAPLELGAGAIRSGSLEQSNVDLSEEFINLIISSTGFSASSRVITTADRLVTELLNSSR